MKLSYRQNVDIDIGALGAVADVAGQKYRSGRRPRVIPELGELLVLVLPHERFCVDLQPVAEEAILAPNWDARRSGQGDIVVGAALGWVKPV